MCIRDSSYAADVRQEQILKAFSERQVQENPSSVRLDGDASACSFALMLRRRAHRTGYNVRHIAWSRGLFRVRENPPGVIRNRDLRIAFEPNQRLTSCLSQLIVFGDQFREKSDSKQSSLGMTVIDEDGIVVR